MFTLICGDKEKKAIELLEKRKFLRQKYYDLYLDYQYGFENLPDIKKSIFYGVKYILSVEINPEITYHDLLKIFSEIQDINNSISGLTIKEFMNIFPINKEYNGKKYCSNDYYSTMEYLQGKNLDDVIGDDRDEFISEYWNSSIISFQVREFMIVNALLKAQNKTGLLEQAMSMLDPEGKVGVYKYNKEEGYMLDSKTGKTFPCNKQKDITVLKNIKE